MLYFEGLFNKEELDKVMRNLGRDVFFVQAGANDGVLEDPISSYVKELGWKGILIEPMEDVFQLLKNNYAGCDGLIFENVAIADYEGIIELARGSEVIAGNYPTDSIASVIPEKSYFKINDPSHMRVTAVQATRLKPVLDKHRVEKIDLMVVDVEGADWMVTRQLDLDKYLPKAVLMEYHQLSSYERTAFGEHFRNHGYRVYIAENAVDVLAVRWPAMKNTGLENKAPIVAEITSTRRTV